MDAQFYNTVSIIYQNLTDRFNRLDKGFIDGYKVYDNDYVFLKDNYLDFLKQFEGVPFGVFFTDSHKELFPTHKYFETETIIFAGDEIKFHSEFSMILFYFLIDTFKDDIQKYLDFFKIDAFEAKFKGFYKINDSNIAYSSGRGEEIFQFFKANINNFGFISHLFSINSNIIQLGETGDILVNTSLISSILKSVNSTYNFQAFNITLQ